MIFWFFGIVALVSAVVAAFFTDFRKVTLALWLLGVSMGCVFLSLGAEFLAVVEWIIATMLATGFLFFSVLFGEFGRKEPSLKDLQQTVKDGRIIPALAAMILAVVFALILVIGSPRQATETWTPTRTEQSVDVAALGQAISNRHFLSVEVLALALLAALIGGGSIARRTDAAIDGEESPTC